MKIIKRNGLSETVKFDKITSRIEGVINTFNNLDDAQRIRLSESKNPDGTCAGLNIDPVIISQKVCSALVDGIKSEEIDRVVSDVAQGMSLKDPDYSVLAGLLCISNLHKCTAKTFHSYAQPLFEQNIISDETFGVCEKHRDTIQSFMKDSHDYAYDFFAYKTLEKSYLTKDPVTRRIVERPQYMWMRVAIGIHGDDISAIEETYSCFVTGRFTHASPTLFNAGTIHPQLASCFLLEIEGDSMQGIFDTVKDCAMISKFAGGIGIHISKIRGNGSHIAGTNGTSSGIIPMCSVFDKTLKFSDQSSKRAGSAAMFLEPWHVDVEDFLELRMPTGAEERRCRELFTAMFINDIFMRRVKDNAKWSLFNEHTTPGLTDAFGDDFDELYERYESKGLWVKQVNAQDIWIKICNSAIMTGTPYITFKDAVNKKSNQSNVGVIKSSNLCVAPETLILTSKGQVPIDTLQDQVVQVWNGKEFSETTVMKTGDSQKLITVELSNGTTVDCTKSHKFYIQPPPREPSKAIEVQAGDLREGMRLIDFELPIPQPRVDEKITINKRAFTQGVFCGNGSYSKFNKTPMVTLTSNQITSGGMNILSLLLATSLGSYNFDTHTQIAYLDPGDLKKRFTVPTNTRNVSDKISWLTGYLSIVNWEVNACGGCNVYGVHRTLFVDIMYMLQTIGVKSAVHVFSDPYVETVPDPNGYKALSKKYLSQIQNVLVINEQSIGVLNELGLNIDTLTSGTHPMGKTDSTRVVSVVDCGRISDTYCFTEPKEHMGVFNGNLLGNCNEIVQVSTPTETAVCNLASVNPVVCIDRETHRFDFNKLGESVEILVRNLNKVIDRTYYPTEKCRRSNMRHRPMGIGLSGLHTAFIVMRYPFESPQAKQLNKDIYECIYYHAVKESCALAERDGPYETFHGSPMSKGQFQFDMWGVTQSDRYDWDALRTDVMTHGVRNSLLIACMPTASSASIIGNSESNDPINSNLYSRKISAGEYMLVNRFLVNDLQKIGLWNDRVKDQLIAYEGSVQNIQEIPQDLKDLYKTSFEISMRSVIGLSADRGAYVCQSQSLNLFMVDPTVARVSSMLFYSWSQGLKSGMYYLRTKARGAAAKFTIDPEVEKAAKQKATEPAVCRRDDPNCLACSA